MVKVADLVAAAKLAALMVVWVWVVKEEEEEEVAAPSLLEEDVPLLMERCQELGG